MQGTQLVRSASRLALALAVCSLALALSAGRAHAAADSQAEIVVGASAPSNERFAAQELRRYLAELTGERLPIVEDSQLDDAGPTSMIAVGQRSTNRELARLIDDGQLPQQAPPPQGYVVKTVTDRGHVSIAVVGGDASGSLYGAYTLLERYGARFYLDRDVLPERPQPFAIKQVDIAEKPAEKVRGLLPWNDFLNGPSGFSYEDYKHYLDQMLKLKMNTLVVHNYAGAYPGANTNEPFMNFECHGTGHDGYLDTSVSNQRWGLAPTRAQDMAFGSGSLLPYDVLGSDAARATNEQPDAQRYIFLKAKAMMQQVIRYAQSRGMEVVLGTDIDELPQAIDAAGCKWNDPDVLKARIDDILDTYPTLKYIQLYIGEANSGATPEVIDALRFVDDYLKSKRPDARIITGGWFQEQRMPEMDRALPRDIIFSMLMPHEMTVQPQWQQLQPGRERWPIPWMEFDGGLSEPQFAVGKMQSVLPQFRAMGVDGMIGILWRTRAASTNVAYLAQDAWQPAGKALDKDAFYRDFAGHNFGAELADAGAAALSAIEATGYPKFNTAEYSGWSFCGCSQADATAATYGDIERRFEAMRAQAPDDTSRANIDYYAAFMRWMRNFWTAQHAVPAAAAKGGPQGDIRINAGGGGSGDLQPDSGYESPSNTYTTSGTVTNDFGYQDAMRSERWADTRPLVYHFDVPNGNYRVELFFQEGYFGVAVPGDPVGKRVFDVELEGQVVNHDFDIAAAAGGSLKGVKLTYEVPVTDGRLDIRFVNVVSNPKVDIIKAIRLDDQGNPAPLPGDPAAAWDGLKSSGFQDSVLAYRDMAGSLPSLGGLVSAAGGRWNAAYRPFERTVANALASKPPDHIVAKGTPGGARITWRPYPGDAGETSGYNVYRRPASGGKFERLTPRAISATSFEDRADGDYRYAVTSLGRKLLNYFLLNAGGTEDEKDLQPDYGSYGSTFTINSGHTVENDFGYPQAMSSARWAPEFGYRFEAPQGYDRYRVELYFAELFYGVEAPGDPVGRRVFDIAINGNVVKRDFDIAKEAGGALKGVRLVFDVSVPADRELDIHFSPQVDNPQVNAIRAYPIDAAGNPLPKEYGPEQESPLSFDARVAAGGADDTAPRVFLLPEELEAVAGEPLRVSATAVDDRDADFLHATLHYRSLSGGPWRSLDMRPNVVGQPTTFYADIPAQASGELEYYAGVSDGTNVGFGPIAGPRRPRSATVVAAVGERPGAVPGLAGASEADPTAALLRWQQAGGDVQQYDVYRGDSPDFPADRAHYLTYVPSQQLVFRDIDVEPGETYYYRVQARSITERSGPASAAVRVTAPAS